jgi:hypothetical protein
MCMQIDQGNKTVRVFILGESKLSQGAKTSMRTNQDLLET